MWFYPLLLLFVLLGLAGIIFLGGVYTLVLVPIAAIGLVSVLGYAMWIRSQAASAGHTGEDTSPAPDPLPHQPQRTPAELPGTPEQLVDARRQSARTPEQ